jgi:2-polyprenyl-3-methyl-5-hydroxy-6-metoxy-1,4-benzoquinol methylase
VPVSEAERFQTVSLDQVQNYWDRRPCNIRHSTKPVGTEEYFNEVEWRKYFVEPHIPLFAEFERWRGKKVLEIGCGIGTDTINFARHGATVTAVDLSEKSIEVARRRAEVFGLQDRIRFFPANAEQLRSYVPADKYDLIYSFGVIHHTPYPGRVLDQLREFVHPGTTIKIMVYHRWSWKVLWILFAYGKGRFWKLKQLIAEYSEAQTGCPVTYSYSRSEGRRWLEDHGLRVTDVRVEHIFPYKIKDYKEYRYKREWYFRWLPRPVFRMLERAFGWHLCLTAAPIEEAPPPAAEAQSRISVRHRNFSSEPLPEGGGTETFDTPAALEINRARLAHLQSLGLPLSNRSVLDAGCGVGHLAQFFVTQNCRVVGLDGRTENVDSLRTRYPGLEAHVADVESDLSRFGQFDIVFSYGLLYHLENPLAALRNMADVCGDLLLLETIVCDHDQPILLLDDETKTYSQALHGLGSRPSPSFVAMALDRAGFPYVYAPRVPPDHPDFRFEWRNNMEWKRDGNLLRCVFVASKRELPNSGLVPVCDPVHPVA